MQDLRQPRVIGERYRLLEELGAGGMGTVWRAHDVLLGRQVAVKEVRLPPELDAQDHAVLLARTMREAKIAAQIDQPNVVRVYDVVEDDQRPWIVMELVEGTNLGQLVRSEGPMPSAAVARVGLAVLRALGAAHAAGVLHRDVKPSNVVLARDGRVVLTDFGVATAVGDPTLTATGLLIGSPSYLPPERARGEAGDARSDLWSLGATLYAAVEGRPPFERDGALSTITAAITEPHLPPTRASSPLRAVINGLLAKDPADRPDPVEVAALLHAAAPGNQLESQVLSPIGIDDTPMPPGERAQPVPLATDAPRPRGRRRLIALALATALATGAAIAVIQLPGPLPWTGDDPTAHESSAAGDPAAAPGGTNPSSVPTVPGAGTSAGTSAGTPGGPTDPGASSSGGTGSSEGSGSEGSPPPAGEVPDGYVLHQDETGFSVAIPAGWNVVRDGSLVDFEDQAGGRFLRIDQTDTPQDDPLADWQAQEPAVAARLGNYHRISMGAVDYRGWAAADWEFTHGESTHVRSRNIVTSPTQAYAIYWSVSGDRWDESLPMLQVFLDTFQPVDD
jgi:serine/threonine protein kinase